MFMSTPPLTAIAAEKVTSNPNENSATASKETCSSKQNRVLRTIRSVPSNLEATKIRMTPSTGALMRLTSGKSPVTPLQVAFAYVQPPDRRHQVHLPVRPRRAATKCRVKPRRKQTRQRC
jgi:hypothetical protein